jgi:hypothetical protein
MRLSSYVFPPALFVIVGPLVGAVAVAVQAGSHLPEAAHLLFFILFSYVAGTMPALIASILYVSLWPTIAKFPWLGPRGFGAALGLAAGVASIPIYGGVVWGEPFHKDPELYVVSALAGAVCGLLSAGICHDPAAVHVAEATHEQFRSEELAGGHSVL